jgi:FkbM family methyltransferase
LLKELASHLPSQLQQELKRFKFGRQLRWHTFSTNEPEFERLRGWIHPGDWAIDVGANIGHYTCRLSELVGPTGRVFSFEPIPQTFELLAANVALLRAPNVTLFNVAASDSMGIVAMSLPSFETGLRNYYMARIVESGQLAAYHVAAIRIDSLELARAVALVKVDAEGHELQVLRGMDALLRAAKPRLIVEGHDPRVEAYLDSLGYGFEIFEGSPNRVYLAH